METAHTMQWVEWLVRMPSAKVGVRYTIAQTAVQLIMKLTYNNQNVRMRIPLSLHHICTITLITMTPTLHHSYHQHMALRWCSFKQEYPSKLAATSHALSIYTPEIRHDLCLRVCFRVTLSRHYGMLWLAFRQSKWVAQFLVSGHKSLMTIIEGVLLCQTYYRIYM